jgi:peptidoglycan/LPS O-acetylase OafA/YrhL
VSSAVVQNPPRGSTGHGHRADIQALRAVAVMMVVVFHLWPRRVTGGYVGVDVFFVISGYLITLHIAQGLVGGAGFSIKRFWIRRVRRLLPASLFVLFLTAIAVPLVLPQSAWSDSARGIIASALYVQNWSLAHSAVDYFGAASGATAVQHFWSLSVEEQFYLFWPILLIALTALSLRRGSDSRRRDLLLGLASVSALSFAYGLWATAHAPASAFFVTPTRIWELGVGGLLAVGLTRPIGTASSRALMAWAGLAAILVSGYFFTAATPFPGYAALLPVVGAAAVIASDDVRAPWGPSPIARLAPVQLLGDISYSLYLWHWPLIILMPTAVGGVGFEMTGPLKLVILVLSIGLAWVTKLFVEDRFRSPAAVAATPPAYGWRTTMLAVGGMAVVIAIAGSSWAFVQPRVHDAEAALQAFVDDPPACYGADALATAAGCSLGGSIVPAPIIARDDRPPRSCIQVIQDSTHPVRCTFGSTAPDAMKVALVGDSHMHRWNATVAEFAKQENWAVTTMEKGGCAFTSARSPIGACQTWNAAAKAELLSGHFDLVLTTAFDSANRVVGRSFDAAVRGFEAMWGDLTSAGVDVVVLADNPNAARAGLRDPVGCVETGGKCRFNRAKAVPRNPMLVASDHVEGVRSIDLNDLFCEPTVCRAVVGGVLVYGDADHMTATFARSLAPYLLSALNAG